MEDLYRYVDDHVDEFVADLVRLCAQPSVAAQGTGLQECAELVAAMLEEAGVRASILPVPGCPFPVVAGEAAGSSPVTLLFYNHYDVQPAEPLDLWDSPPFTPRLADGKLYARGVSDNKGPLVARIAALKAFRAVRGELPAGVKFLIEGEEEIGSSHLLGFLETEAERFRADACLWEGFGVNGQDQLQIILGAKGLVYVELEARTAGIDIHSSWATVAPNPAWRLAWALASLKGPDERILIDGFYDDVLPPSEADMAALALLPDERQETCDIFGLTRLIGSDNSVEFWRQHLLEPTCNICGIESGYTGVGAKTVLPAWARAKLDFRLVPDQRPEDIEAKLRRHLEQHGFSDVAVTGAIEGEPPARTPMDAPFVALTASTAREVFGTEPVLMPSMAATGPMAQVIETLGVPVADSGVGYPDNRIHAPNENIRIADYVKGIKHVVALLAGMPELRK
ncbi:MAG: M20/M25/M40 family metallo-hydrolase [Chloroflexi bacterium]|nr:M20/M25/M40 family metallo-hydrolase [Chloroflexota bacterium]